jgi:hypothetical protein
LLDWRDSMDWVDCQDRIDLSDSADNIEKALATQPTEYAESAEPAEPTERIEPAEPTDSTEPTDPIERIEPLEPMLRMESADPTDHSDPRCSPMASFFPAQPGSRQFFGNGEPALFHGRLRLLNRAQLGAELDKPGVVSSAGGQRCGQLGLPPGHPVKLAFQPG